MPDGAHGETAGTDAIIDVLVLRRHDGAPPAEEPAWLRTVDVNGAAGSAPVNSYFADRPDQVLGGIDTRLGQFGPTITVHADDVSAAAVAPRFAAALERVVDEAIASGSTWQADGRVVTDRPVATALQDPDHLVGHIDVDDSGALTVIGMDGPEPVNVPKNAVQELTHLVEIRDAAVTLLEAEAATHENTPAIDKLRNALNDVYDRYVESYGPLGRVSTTVRERAGKDPVITRRYPAAVRALRQDPHYATVAALERYNEDTGEARKSTIFTERVVGVTVETDRVESAEDAIRVSLDRVGQVDVPLVAELLDVDEASVPDRLGELVFLNPDDLVSYVPAEEYLSGNVRQKLKDARYLAEVDQRFQRHVAELEPVVPEELGPAEIDVKLGASWVPVDDVEAFIEKELKKEVNAIERIDGEWRFKLRGRATDSVEAKWGVEGEYTKENAERVFKRVLNGEPLELRYRPDKDAPLLVDQVGTEELQERVQELHDTFQDWLWRDVSRVERLQERYNDLYNGIVLRSYDGVELTFPGKAATFTPRPHQHAAVARMLAEPATGLFHEVGAGKTAEMVLGVMELRRLGMVTKPAIIVPNQMLEQFVREFKQIYPRAKVLAAGSEDISTAGSKDGRKLFVARARTGDWDAVIMTHGSFGKIGLGAAQAVYAQERLAEMQDVHSAKLDSELSAQSVKRLEQQLSMQEEKLKFLMDLPHDSGVTWEETGIDYLCVDEGHFFKNLTVVSKVGDLSKPIGSGRATDLDMKLWYHRDHMKQSRVVTIATATPLPNSMIEMYVMMRYLRPDLLQAAEVYAADDWARQFTEQVTAVEAKPDGGGYQVKTCTTKFRNLPELLRMWHVPGDVKTQADLGLPVPRLVVNTEGVRAPEMVVVPATAAQQEGMAEIIDRGEAVRSGVVAPEEDNMLKITANGRALALDARLLGGDEPGADEITKLDVVASRIFKVWQENRDREYLDEWGDLSPTRGALQLVFSDLGTLATDGRWDAYTHLRRVLVDQGIPADQIRFIHEASNDQAKAELFQQCREGRVQVLLGSTEKMGVGTNVQARAVALHHIDAPWRPADVTQREGREIRQGNQNDEVQIVRYATEGSFDAYMWGTLARKAAFIEQVLTGRLDVREVDNSTEMALQFAEMQAVTAGDMRILEVANLRADVQKLGRQQRAHQRKVSSTEARRLIVHQETLVVEHDLKVLRALEPSVVDTRGDRFAGAVRPNSWAEQPELRDRTEFALALREQVVRIRQEFGPYGFSTQHTHYPRPLHLGVTVAGIEWEVQLRWNRAAEDDPLLEFHAGRTHRAMQMQMNWLRVMSGDPVAVAQRFESQAREIPDLIRAHQARLEAGREEITDLKKLEQEPWPRKDELQQKQSRLAALVGELEREALNQDATTAPGQDVPRRILHGRRPPPRDP
ncbi:MAG: hypothetical protein ACK5LO_07620 [Leucobacter sp.]